MGSIFQGRELRGVHEGPAAYECMSILRNAVTSLAERLLGGLILALVSVFVLFVLPIHCLRPSSSLFFLLLVTHIRGHMYVWQALLSPPHYGFVPSIVIARR